MTDIHTENHGSIWLLRPVSDAGRNWLAEHLDDAQWFGGAVAVEPRYVEDIVEGASLDGLEVN
jgi:hypothetical protein